MTLAAGRPNVLWMVIRESVMLVAVGLACGLPLAIAGSRWIKTFLSGPVDPVSLGNGHDPAGCGLERRQLSACPAGYACRSGCGFSV